MQCFYKNERETEEQITPSRACILSHKPHFFFFMCVYFKYCTSVKVNIRRQRKLHFFTAV